MARKRNDEPVVPRKGHPLYTGTALFALGGVLVLAGTPMAATGYPWTPGPLLAVTIAAIVVLLVGWERFFDGLPTPWNRPGPAAVSLRERAMTWVFAGSSILVPIGILTLLFAYPQSTPWLPPAWTLALATGVFLYVPSVWTPVVLGHAATFLVGGTTLEDRVATWYVIAGSAILVGVSVLAIVFQAVSGLSPGSLWWALSGLTSPGYALVAMGWRREAQTQWM